MDVREEIRQFAESQPDIIAVYLFGSQASGKAHRFSDVDVAALLPTDMPADERFDRRLLLLDELERRLGLPVDFIVLNDAPPLLQFKVFSTGERLFERDRAARCEFQMYAMSRYYDEKYYLDYHRREFIKRVKEQGFGRGHRSHRDARAEIKRISERIASTSGDNS